MQMDGLEIRRMMPGEAEEVHRLEEACFSDPWSAHSLMDMLSSPHALYLVAVLDGRVVGYCGTQMVLDEGEILRVAVDEEYRDRKIGSALFEKILSDTPGIISWNLDVRESNAPAIGLYTKYGFQPVGKRRGYYRHPTEDAVLMTLSR